jgi:hypothetical protein
MTITNGYATLANLKDWLTTRGGQQSYDSADDSMIEQVIEAASRYIDSETGRTFYPRVETRYYDLPDGREIWLDDDLLTVTTLTNGDGTVLTTTYYYLYPKNRSPKWKIVMKESSTYSWSYDGYGNTEGVITVVGTWGYHDNYTQRGWFAASTIAEDLDISETAWDVASGIAYSPGQIVKVDSEMAIVSSISGNTVTVVQRAENGSTAATHTSGATLYRWVPMENIRHATLLIAQNVYSSRSGQTSGGRITITAAGIVIRPEDVPPLALATIEKYREHV